MNVKYEVFPLPSPYSFECPNYVNVNNGNKERVVVVIVPVSFTKTGAFSWQIGWSCNLKRTCKNQACLYARGGQEE